MNVVGLRMGLRGLATGLAAVLLVACSSTPTPSPSVSALGPSLSPVAQDVRCNRVANAECAQVLGVVEARVPDTRQSRLAIVDYSAFGPGPSTFASPIYLVSFAPWGSGDLWMSPPTWRVTNQLTNWYVVPEQNVRDLPVCFVMLLRDANLTDYAPTFPSGICG